MTDSTTTMKHFTSITRTLLLLACCLLAPAAWAQAEGVEVGETSRFSKLVPADQIESAAAQQYQQLLQSAQRQKALAPESDPQLQRLRRIVQRLIPLTQRWNPRVQNWRWEVNLIRSKQINAFCMPGGKIAFYSGLIDQLQASDDEIAMVMGHEMAHALREHARAQMGKNTATQLGANLLSHVLGWGQTGQTLAGYGTQLLALQFSREDESEADLVGLELAARAGFNPHAAVSLWKKMDEHSQGKPPEWLSTHPANDSRIAEIETNLHRVMPLYERAIKETPSQAPAAKVSETAPPQPTGQ